MRILRCTECTQIYVFVFFFLCRVPVQVNLQAKDLAAELEASVSNSRCSISTKGSVR